MDKDIQWSNQEARIEAHSSTELAESSHEILWVTIEFKEAMKRVNLLNFITETLLGMDLNDYDNNYWLALSSINNENALDAVAFIWILKKHPKESYEHMKKHFEWKLDFYEFENLLWRLEDVLMFKSLNQLVEKINQANNFEERDVLARELEEEIEWLLWRHIFSIYIIDKEKPLTLAMFKYIELDSLISIQSQDWHIIHSTWWFYEPIIALREVYLERKVRELIWIHDREKLQEETMKYGAKWANLEILSIILPELSSFIYLNCSVPSFERMSVDIYKKWKKWELIKDELEIFYQWIRRREVILRSSAVYSEDGEDSTWAWVYKSIQIKADASYEEFEKVVIEIYESVDSDYARNYRDRSWIANEEEMWIVIQEYVSDDNELLATSPIVANSVLRQVPALMEIKLEKEWIRPIIDKTKLKIAIWCINDKDIFHYQPDSKRFENISMNKLRLIAQLIQLIETYYWQAIQLEMIYQKWWEMTDWWSNCREIDWLHLLQARYLPRNYSVAINVEFPDKEPLFDWEALWVWDLELYVLPNKEDNSEKDWIVFFKGSGFATLCKSWIDSLPRSWVVVVLSWSTANWWHIETICAERWLLLIFDSTIHERSINEVIAMQRWSNTAPFERCIDEYEWYKKVRAVLNWIKWKIYPPEGS